jgi:hypothetical protein
VSSEPARAADGARVRRDAADPGGRPEARLDRLDRTEGSIVLLHKASFVGHLQDRATSQLRFDDR